MTVLSPFVGQTNNSNITSPPSTSRTGSPHYSNNSIAKVVSSMGSPQGTNISVAQKEPHCNSGAGAPLSLDKQHSTADVKNPSVAKVVPFSHQPSGSKSTVSACTSSVTANNSTVTNFQVKPEGQTVSQCNALSNNVTRISGSQVAIAGQQCVASEDGTMTVFAPSEDGQLRPTCKIICSCQLRQRALKYGDKGKTKDDCIVIDSDEEEEEKNVEDAETLNNQGILITYHNYSYLNRYFRV